jgi:hypothetical protein
MARKVKLVDDLRHQFERSSSLLLSDIDRLKSQFKSFPVSRINRLPIISISYLTETTQSDISEPGNSTIFSAKYPAVKHFITK